MAYKVTNDWKDHGWWIIAKEAEIPMLWITSHVVVEGRHWCTTYYHTDVHIYIYEIKYFFVVPYRVQRVQISCILLPTDGMEVHWQCTSHHSLENTNG
jgi:hypothetical protein